ncbi:uncharacterized protein [Drosophila virilis]|uniref:Uncharacterized protein n=1 Tax=Drosophila virilis TaxID=7244 RepID=B4LRW8_DROVI|nr:uncharacterized protein LOC6628494 [Drosophila virilis]EDW63644.2 uncharacterized protein Dvir_GJ11976 [Drosophila virilis]
MAEPSIAEQLKMKKLKLTLDEYSEQYVNKASANEETAKDKHRENYIFDTNIMELTLDEYYEKFVLPKVKLQAAKHEEEHKNIRYQRTHYFGPSFLERQRQPREPSATDQKESTTNM